MDIDNWDEEQDKNRKLDKYEILIICGLISSKIKKKFS